MLPHNSENETWFKDHYSKQDFFVEIKYYTPTREFIKRLT